MMISQVGHFLKPSNTWDYWLAFQLRIARLVMDDEDVLAYDKLVLSTGSYPFVPPIEGNDREQCFVYRTLDDLTEIRQACEKSSSGAVIWWWLTWA